jgi:hypothetical protein
MVSQDCSLHGFILVLYLCSIIIPFKTISIHDPTYSGRTTVSIPVLRKGTAEGTAEGLGLKARYLIAEETTGNNNNKPGGCWQ